MNRRVEVMVGTSELTGKNNNIVTLFIFMLSNLRRRWGRIACK
jgi:hypothetical protein